MREDLLKIIQETAAGVVVGLIIAGLVVLLLAGLVALFTGQ